jgi:hypothetical protein
MRDYWGYKMKKTDKLRKKMAKISKSKYFLIGEMFFCGVMMCWAMAISLDNIEEPAREGSRNKTTIQAPVDTCTKNSRVYDDSVSYRQKIVHFGDSLHTMQH